MAVYTDTRGISTTALTTALNTLETAVVGARNKGNHHAAELALAELNKLAAMLRELHL